MMARRKIIKHTHTNRDDKCTFACLHPLHDGTDHSCMFVMNLPYCPFHADEMTKRTRADGIERILKYMTLDNGYMSADILNEVET